MASAHRLLFFVSPHFIANDNIFSMTIPQPVQCSLASSDALVKTLLLLHRRLGHCNDSTLLRLLTPRPPNDRIVDGLPALIVRRVSRLPFCDSCALAKSSRVSCSMTPGSSHNSVVRMPSQVVNSLTALQLPSNRHTFAMDLKGPIPTLGFGNKRYALIVTSLSTRFRWIFFLASKSDTAARLEDFLIILRPFSSINTAPSHVQVRFGWRVHG